jgi:hypothetical protein
VMYVEVTLFRCVVMQAMVRRAPKLLLQPFVAGCDAEASPSLFWMLALAGEPSFLFR